VHEGRFALVILLETSRQQLTFKFNIADHSNYLLGFAIESMILLHAYVILKKHVKTNPWSYI
jgi:hypothetical protein